MRLFWRLIIDIHLGSLIRLPFPLFSFLNKKEKELHSSRAANFGVPNSA